MADARDIIHLVDGKEISDGLSTVCLALIHIAFSHGFSKEDALRAMAGQWDLYANRQKEKMN